MKLAVLGAAGQLGRAIVAAAHSAGHEVAAWSRTECDITDPVHLGAVIGAFCPEAVINAAAFAQVDEAEDDPITVFAINAWAVRDLARLARRRRFALVHFSTDFVFDGATDRPYVEDDPPHPRGVYATSKLIGEWMAAGAPEHYVLRVESLFGGERAKSSVDGLLAGLRAGRPVRAFADRTVTPSYVGDVAHATVQVLERRAPAGVYHCVNSGVATWLEVAHALARLTGASPALIEPVDMAGLSLRVPRPLRAALSNAKLHAAGIVMPDWRDALSRYLAGCSDAR